MREIENEENELLGAARAGDRDAFSELIMRHADQVFHAARRITRHREDAEDAVQESITNAFAGLGSFDGASRFSTWLTRIAINAALMNLRKKRLSREVALEEPKEESWGPAFWEAIDGARNPEEWDAKQEHDRIVREAVAKLRSSLRDTVEVYDLKEKSIQETAHTLGISKAAAKARLFHARRALRKEPQLRAIFERTQAVIRPARLSVRRCG